MENHGPIEIDYGTGQKTLGIYLSGSIACAILTLLAFAAVLWAPFTRLETIAIIYSAAIIQFAVQVLCFLRLNSQSPQGKINLLSLVFTIVILISIVAGSLWIMTNLNYFMGS